MTGICRDVSGGWEGHYTQGDRDFPITAELVQRGERLSGRMRDGETWREGSLAHLAADFGLSPGAAREIESRLRHHVPNLAPAEIRYTLRLPPDSTLSGRVTGDAVAFVKTYRGTLRGEYTKSGKAVARGATGNKVHYEGRLSEDGTVIEGHWSIEPQLMICSHRIEGRFRLRRSNEAIDLLAESVRRPWWRFWSRAGSRRMAAAE